MRGASTMRIALVAVIVLLAVGGGDWDAFGGPGGANAADPPKATAPGSSSGDQPAPRSTVVEVGRVELGPVVRAMGSVGKRQSNATVIIRPENVGRIRAIDFREGKVVHTGALLVNLHGSVYPPGLATTTGR